MTRTTSKRDPRIDPKPGDEVGRRQVLSVVCEVGTGHVLCVEWVVSSAEWGSCSLRSWRRWAKNAEVIYVAE
jgi:hypothetical protein